MKTTDFLTELSNDKLTQYKTAAAADASKADKEGDFKKGDKRFSGIVKATKKQFDNDAKKDVAEGSEDDIEDTRQFRNAIALAKSQKAIRQAKDGKNAKYYADGTKVTPDEIARRAAERTAKKQGVAEGSLEELANTSLKVKEPKNFVNTNDRKQVVYKVMKFKSGKDTYLINFTVKGAPAFGKKQNWNAVNVSFGVREEQDDYSFGDEINTDLTAKNKNQFLIYSTVINAVRKFITEYNTEIDEIIMQGAEERQAVMYQRFFQSAGKYFPGWHHDGKHSLVRDVPRQTGKKVKEQGVAEGWSQKYKRSINCSHPKGFSQKAHCAGKKKHNESIEMEMVCEDCGMCETHSDHENLDEACWKGYHKEGNKKMFGKTYPNCVKNTNEEQEVEEDARIARKPGQPAGSKKHSDLYTDENPKGTITGLKFATAEDARASVSKIRNSGRSHAHKIQAAVAMEQRAKAAGKAEAASVYRKYINATKKTDEGINLEEACWDTHKQVGMKKKGGKMVPNCVAKEDIEQHSESCPHCGGKMVSEELMNEIKDACYSKVKSRYKVWPSAYASGALVKCRKVGAANWGNGGKKNESSILEGIEQADESLHDWFNKEKWVRMDTKGNIKGPCAKEPGEGKPKCLPQAKAHSLGKKGRASAAARKRREDPNPDRSGKAINVNTKKD